MLEIMKFISLKIALVLFVLNGSVTAQENTQEKIKGGVGMWIGAGAELFNGPIAKYHRVGPSVVLGFNMMLHRVVLNFHTYTGAATLDQSIVSIDYSIAKGERNFWAFNELSAGYEVVSNPRFSVCPTLGANFMIFGPTNLERVEGDGPYRTNFTGGCNLAYKFFKDNAENVALEIKSRVSYTLMDYAGDMDGSQLHLSLGVGFFVGN